MKRWTILWKRLVTMGRPVRVAAIPAVNLKRRVNKLRIVLHPLGIEPLLQTEEIDEATFKTNTAESNRVWIQGRPLEDWLGADVRHEPLLLCVRRFGLPDD